MVESREFEGDFWPLAEGPPEEVPLANAPLIKVIAQVRFPMIASVGSESFIGPFQEAIRARYPILRPQYRRAVSVATHRGDIGADAFLGWSFHEASGPWRVVLTPSHVTLETDKYSSRDEFMARLERILHALDATIGPQIVDRLGVRYVDRVTGPNLDDLAELIRPEVAGVLGAPFHSSVQHSVTESIFNLPDGTSQITARWGRLPANTTTYPTTVPPVNEASWILDLDVYREYREDKPPFDVDALIADARSFAERLYSVFRWAVTDEFLKRYGAQR